ncbi:glycolate oxidase subunit GlcF [Pusillimonas noertemannii]|uniref:Glycolate oxidase iron-sulfur subunit n=1 Tax=Pusillimonas noertemannii TaxID=305977 RepID=A0A2U1CH12_9BURK|nr:glycolate oxidase subunit GlcF [Pusillimonas noertemannii]NYT68238.1 glycolate oxidase subunit GlcF [Pusillimonas noertemannii]PVY60208.1 glycolate oxidase iron-sulfur subunit [Pusillimonas noertemannii]TFL10318.1 glycolate oxidase subunit GlcF [Pusillimonas noertemannii]
MQTNLSDQAKQLPRADEAERILRSCVHCGFCNATCPTYQVLGDELDGPRGRIYLIKSLLEGGEATARTQQHLDRCLTCRNCETTCPSGVEYHTLLDIGREEIERRVRRPLSQRLLRGGLRQVVPRRMVFATLLRIGQAVRGLLPAAIRAKVPARAPAAGARPAPRHERRMLMLEGCVQPSLSPNTNAATARVLDRLGISIVEAGGAGCCGATDYHLNDQQKGLDRARRNIDAWWPAIEAGAQAIVQTASGCGAFVKEYGHLLRHDPAYAHKARRVSELALDISEVLRAEKLQDLGSGKAKIAFHCPCTLQHAQKLGGAVEDILGRFGFDLAPVPNAHLCCGSAGTYSITEPELSNTLRRNKVEALESGGPELIATANIGCQTHLAGAARVPVRHWIELIDAHLPPRPSA